MENRPPTASEIDGAAAVLSEMIRPHLVAAIDAHKPETLAKLPWPATSILEKHWACIDEMVPKMAATAIRGLLGKFNERIAEAE
jgi:hypothetical protein